MTARKLVILVSHDAHARAILRKRLELDGFSVGEAANADEGDRTVRRVKPDATIADLQLEIVEGRVGVIEKLHEAHAASLLYLLTTGDAATLSFGWDALGVAGIFLKPMDAEVISAALHSALGI
jgi:DNA-binding NarL/FixJ family response regulator